MPPVPPSPSSFSSKLITLLSSLLSLLPGSRSSTPLALGTAVPFTLDPYLPPAARTRLRPGRDPFSSPLPPSPGHKTSLVSMPPAQGVDYESKGLSQVKLDAVTSLSSDSELSGSAWLDPTDAFPVDRWAADDLEFPRRVRFRAVSGRNKEGEILP